MGAYETSGVRGVQSSGGGVTLRESKGTRISILNAGEGMIYILANSISTNGL